MPDRSASAKTEGVGIAEEHYLLNFPFSIYKKHDGF